MIQPSKFSCYSATSLAVMACLIVHSTYLHAQFFPTVVWLTTSKISRVSIANTSFVILAIAGHVIKWMFFGTLKPRELEVRFLKHHCIVVPTKTELRGPLFSRPRPTRPFFYCGSARNEQPSFSARLGFLWPLFSSWCAAVMQAWQVFDGKAKHVRCVR